jgi:tRNA threonylcarbamoyladenosine biosynthesis protein TsaB
MNLLAIDTSTESASVALSINGELRSEEQGAQRSHARLLLPMIEQLLTEAQVSLSQLDGIVYGRGPGSFTGLRIACSVAKGLAYAQDLPLYPVSSLAAIANEALFIHDKPPNTNVLALLDARMNQLYWACFNQNGSEVLEQVSAAADIDCKAAETPLILAGLGYESYLSQISQGLQARIRNHYIIYPKAEAMIRLVLTGTIKPVSASEALPVYIRNQITQGEPRG